MQPTGSFPVTFLTSTLTFVNLTEIVFIYVIISCRYSLVGSKSLIDDSLHLRFFCLKWSVSDSLNDDLWILPL